MGPGTATTMVKIAAATMQLPAEKIKFQLGDTDFPPGPTQGGSATTSTLGSSVNAVCEALKEKLKEMAIANAAAFKNYKAEELDVLNGAVLLKKDPSQKIELAALLQAAGKPEITIEKESGPVQATMRQYAMNSFSAHFVKVLVNPQTGAVQLKQVVATGDGGKIISPKTARSQMIGGAVGGIGMALTEEGLIDPKTGKYLTDSLGKYHLPRNRDVPFIDTWFPDKADPVINAMGSKGVGEIALVGFAAAVANAVFNATGKRVRSLPIKPEQLVGQDK